VVTADLCSICEKINRPCGIERLITSFKLNRSQTLYAHGHTKHANDMHKLCVLISNHVPINHRLERTIIISNLADCKSHAGPWIVDMNKLIL